MPVMRSAVDAEPSASVNDAPCRVSSALKGTAQRAAKRRAFCATRRMLGSISIPDSLMSPPVCRLAQASRAALASSTGTRPRSEAYQRLAPVEVLLVDDGLVSDGQDVVGDVEQWGVGDGLGVEVPQLLGVGDVEALKGLLDGAPGGVAGLGVSIGAKTQCGVDALAGLSAPRTGEP